MQKNSTDGYFRLPGHRKLRGTSFSSAHTEETLDGVANLAYEADDVIVASLPKTGEFLSIIPPLPLQPPGGLAGGPVCPVAAEEWSATG